MSQQGGPPKAPGWNLGNLLLGSLVRRSPEKREDSTMRSGETSSPNSNTLEVHGSSPPSRSLVTRGSTASSGGLVTQSQKRSAPRRYRKNLTPFTVKSSSARRLSMSATSGAEIAERQIAWTDGWKALNSKRPRSPRPTIGPGRDLNNMASRFLRPLYPEGENSGSQRPSKRAKVEVSFAYDAHRSTSFDFSRHAIENLDQGIRWYISNETSTSKTKAELKASLLPGRCPEPVQLCLGDGGSTSDDDPSTAAGIADSEVLAEELDFKTKQKPNKSFTSDKVDPSLYDGGETVVQGKKVSAENSRWGGCFTNVTLNTWNCEKCQNPYDESITVCRVCDIPRNFGSDAGKPAGANSATENPRAGAGSVAAPSASSTSALGPSVEFAPSKAPAAKIKFGIGTNDDSKIAAAKSPPLPFVFSAKNSDTAAASAATSAPATGGFVFSSSNTATVAKKDQNGSTTTPITFGTITTNQATTSGTTPAPVPPPAPSGFGFSGNFGNSTGTNQKASLSYTQVSSLDSLKQAPPSINATSFSFGNSATDASSSAPSAKRSKSTIDPSSSSMVSSPPAATVQEGNVCSISGSNEVSKGFSFGQVGAGTVPPALQNNHAPAPVVGFGNFKPGKKQSGDAPSLSTGFNPVGSVPTSASQPAPTFQAGASSGDDISSTIGTAPPPALASVQFGASVSSTSGKPTPKEQDGTTTAPVPFVFGANNKPETSASQIPASTNGFSMGGTGTNATSSAPSGGAFPPVNSANTGKSAASPNVVSFGTGSSSFPASSSVSTFGTQAAGVNTGGFGAGSSSQNGGFGTLPAASSSFGTSAATQPLNPTSFGSGMSAQFSSNTAPSGFSNASGPATGANGVGNAPFGTATGNGSSTLGAPPSSFPAPVAAASSFGGTGFGAPQQPPSGQSFGSSNPSGFGNSFGSGGTSMAPPSSTFGQISSQPSFQSTSAAFGQAPVPAPAAPFNSTAGSFSMGATTQKRRIVRARRPRPGR